MINLSALFIRRKLGWFATICRAKEENITRCTLTRSQNLLEGFLFDVTIEEFKEIIVDKEKFNALTEKCIKKYGL